MRYRLLRCLAQAVAKNGVKFLCGLVPGGDVLFDIAADAWAAYCQDCQANSLRTELGELAQASAAEVQREARQAAQAAAAHLPADAQRQLAVYLGQVPGMIRRSLRRPSDPTGTTVPANLPLRSPADLLPFLPPSPPRFQPGMRPLPGLDWVLEEPLGVGGFGEVWKARHARLRSKPPVALKFCLDPSAAKVLRNEAGVLDRLMRHGRLNGIVPLLDAYLDADPPCLVYEYVEGGDLMGLIREMHARVRPTPASANRLLLRLAEIIAAPHRANPAIVHDDLKPSNILIGRAGKTFKLFVTDYGIGGLAVARAVRQTRQPTNSREQLLTEAVRGAYTPLYASPQQMARRRDEPADTRDDVHALGVIWYQLVTGDLTMLQVPADWTEEVRGRGLSEELIGLLGSCLASKAEKRPASAGILAGELRALTKPASQSGLAEKEEAELRALTTPTAKPPPAQRPPPLTQPKPKPPKTCTPQRRSFWRRPVVWLVLILLMLSAPLLFGFLWANWPKSAVPGAGVTLANPKVPDQNKKPDVAPEPQKNPPVSNPPVAAAPQKGQDYTNSIGMKFKWIEPGSFLMGSPDGTTPPGVPAEKDRGDDETPHQVTLTKGFHMGTYLVTQEQWERVMEKDANNSIFMGKSDEEKKKLPVDSVSWDDCQEFCRKLSTLEARKYTLPTEAQWEYACRAGTSTAFWWGDTKSAEGANRNGTKTTPVDFFKPNPWGLYDMHGSLWQWCADYYDPKYYTNGPNKDPENILKSDARVLRGGSLVLIPGVCRAACRLRFAPGNRNIRNFFVFFFGCRIALRLD